MLHVTMQLPSGEEKRIVRLPVWNALYQVRDFAQYVEGMSAQNMNGAQIPQKKIETSAWQVSGVQNGATISYDVYADNPGPYGAQANGRHVFLNLAEVLLYEDSGAGRHGGLVLQFNDIPAEWSYASALRGQDAEFERNHTLEILAASYDQLVDNPVELGNFHESSFQDGATTYRIAIDADPSDYDSKAIESSIRKIVHIETEWMKEQPCSTYVFIYHFPCGQGGGGMEHACSTVIDLEAGRLREEDMDALEGVTAHEFFHLWNVKRIRPQSLEPIDYTKEQYTRALWFSEGVTSTVEDITLLRAGLITGQEYLRRLGNEIDTLQQRPAHKTQSAEESSLDAWFEKYPFYRRSERSISYYNKGEILGVMLDLAVREATEGNKSLRDIFLWMNENYARKGKFFADSEGVRNAVETVSGRDFKAFFERYVAGTEEIPYDQFLTIVGFRIKEVRTQVVDLGFSSSRNFDAPMTVQSVHAGSDAQHAGLKAGDTLIKANDKAGVSGVLAGLSPGDTLHLRVRRQGQESELKFKVGSMEESHFTIVEVEHPTEMQLKQRAEWLATPISKDAIAVQQGAERN